MKYIRVYTSFMLFLLSSSTGMQNIHFKEQLSEIEKLIVLHKMKHASHKIDFNAAHIFDAPIITKIEKDRTDDFATLIMETIKEQEKELGYVPEQISEKIDGVWHLTIPTNYIGKYTRYYHTKDFAGEYIELHSTFIYQPAVLEVLNNYSS